METSRSSAQISADTIQVAKETIDFLPVAVATELNIHLRRDEQLKEYVQIRKKETTEDEGCLYDLRMGASKEKPCLTCNQPYSRCEGHKGVIDVGFIHPIPLYMNEIIKLLNITCANCGFLMEQQKDVRDWIINYDETIDKLDAVHSKIVPAKNTKTKPTCHNCKTIKDYIYVSQEPKHKFIRQIFGTDTKTDVSFQEVYAHLELIRNDVMKFLNIPYEATRFMTRYVVVVRNRYRPIIITDNGISHHALTRHYITLLTALEDMRGKERDINKEFEIFKLIKDMVDKSADASSNSRTNEPESIKSIIQGKRGFFRDKLVTKVVSGIVRSVISPGPDIEYGYVGIPESIAARLPIPELVNAINMNNMKTLIIRGKVNRIIKANGKTFDLVPLISVPGRGAKNLAIKANELEIGDTVERHMRDGDYVCFNRAPTIQTYSFHGCRAKIIKGDTIKLHMGVTNATNADFDGDESQVHIRVSALAEAEIAELMDISKCGTNPLNSASITGLVYDGLISVYLLSKPASYIIMRDLLQILYQSTTLPSNSGVAKTVGTEDILALMRDYEEKDVSVLRYGSDIELSEKERDERNVKQIVYNEILAHIRDTQQIDMSDDFYLKEIAGMTIREHLYEMRVAPVLMFSYLLPTGYNYNANGIVIKNRVLVKGMLNKANMGIKSNTVLQNLFKVYGDDFARQFFSKLNFMLTAYLDKIGFTLDIESCFPDKFYNPGAVSGYLILNTMKYIEQNNISIEDIYGSAINRIIEEIVNQSTDLAEGVDIIMEKRNRKLYINILVDLFRSIRDEALAIEKYFETNKLGSNIYMDEAYQMMKDKKKWKYPVYLIAKILNFHEFITKSLINAQKQIEELQAIVRDAPDMKQVIDRQTRDIVSNLTIAIQSNATKMADKSSNLSMMIDSGAKGEAGNRLQMVAAITQQYILNERIKANRFNQTLPYFDYEEENNILASGFVRHGFTQGISLAEFIFHQGGARGGVIDATLKVAEIGTAANDLRSINRDTTVRSNGTVSNGEGQVVQYGYGDGLFPGELIEIKRYSVIADFAAIADRVNEEFLKS